MGFEAGEEGLLPVEACGEGAEELAEAGFAGAEVEEAAKEEVGGVCEEAFFAAAQVLVFGEEEFGGAGGRVLGEPAACGEEGVLVELIGEDGFGVGGAESEAFGVAGAEVEGGGVLQFCGDAVDEPEGDFDGLFAGEAVAYFEEQEGDAVSEPCLAADFGAEGNLVCPTVGEAGGADLEEVGVGFAGVKVEADFAAPAVWGAEELQEVFFDALGGNGGEFGSEGDEAGGFFIFAQRGGGEGFAAADEELAGAAFDGAEVGGGGGCG